MYQKKVIFVLFCLANVAISFNFAALAAVVPAMSQDLLASDMVVSQVSAFYMIPYGFGALMYAPLAGRISFKAILSTCMVVYAATNVVSAASSSIGVILAARILMGLAAASVIPMCLMSIGMHFEREIRGRLVGMFFSTSFIASILGLMVSGMLSWRWLFIIPAGMAACSAIFILSFSNGRLGRQPIGPVNYMDVWRGRQIRGIFIFIFVMSFLYHGVHKWFGVYLFREYHLTQMVISFYFILIAVFGAAGQNLGGWITDKKGRFNACLSGVLILSFSTMLLLGKYPLIVLACIFAAFSIGWTIGHNGISTVLTDFPDEDRAEIASVNSAVRFVSGGLGFMLGGAFVERNFGLTFFGFGFMMFLTVFFLRKIIPTEQREASKGGQPWLT